MYLLLTIMAWYFEMDGRTSLRFQCHSFPGPADDQHKSHFSRQIKLKICF